ncbi:MAG: PAS domain-containing protein [Chloroflexi bacterium]|nr:PAS domain-containing protein [Chloroflexota bacterium]MCC6891909.1 PAS domain-containing protein [Anaerolineae bacterium]
MQQPKNQRPSISITTLAVALVVCLVGLLVVASLVLARLRDGVVDPSIFIILVGMAAVGAALAVVLVLSLRQQANQTEQLEAEFRRQNGELLRANNDLQSQLSGRASELADERTQSKTILQSMSEAVVVLDSERVRYTNRALTRLTGFSGDDLTSKPLGAENAIPLAAQLVNFRETALTAIAQGGMWQAPSKLNIKDGKELDVYVIGLPLDAGLSKGQVLLLIRDNSHEKRLQAQKNTFVTNASHELRTPLSNIKNRLYLLRRQPEKLEEHVAVMDEMAAHMQQLLEEMLDIGRFERGLVMLDRDNAILQDLVSEAVTTYQPRAARRSITLEPHLAEQPIKVLVDHKRIVQVVTNLISNAVNHTPQDGHIDVRVEMDANSNGRRLAYVQVQDNGMGISQEMLAQIFQPFTNASMGLVSGTVLGLSLTKEIVELHGGDINVESDAKKGTLYTVRLPVLE